MSSGCARRRGRERERSGTPARAEGFARPVLGSAAAAVRRARLVATRTRPTSGGRRSWRATSSSADPNAGPSPFTGRTAWARNLQTPLREFLRTETGGAAVLLVAAVAALVWVNVHASSYEALWETTLSIDLGDAGISLDLRHWVNSGLMTFFFFVLGLEARREFDLGDLRERRRFALPLLAGIGGMALAVAIYLAFNGRSSAQGWGIAMSTDTAFALGLLALVGPRFPDRLRAFMLTVVVVDDILALVVIATVYTEQVSAPALVAAFGLFGAVLVARALGVRVGLVYFALGVAIWVALLESGVEPVVVGLAMGLLAYAYPAARSELERATERFREFREQPTPALARSVGIGLRAAVSPNERLQQLYHLDELPHRSPVRARERRHRNRWRLPRRGLHLAHHTRNPPRLRHRQARRHSRLLVAAHTAQPRSAAASGRLGTVAGGGTIAGIGFTIALLVAALAFEGQQLEEAKLGILSAAVGAALVRLAAVSRDGAAATEHAHPRPARNRGVARRPLHRGRPERDHIRVDRRSGHGRRVRRLPVPLLRAG